MTDTLGLAAAMGRRGPVKEAVMKRFDVGARVVEPTYGLGSVVAVEDAYTRVQFDEHGVKKFLTSMSHLEPSHEPVPARPAGGAGPRRAAQRQAAQEAHHQEGRRCRRGGCRG